MASLSQPLFSRSKENCADLARLLLQHIWGIQEAALSLNASFLTAYYFSCISLADSAYLALNTHQDIVELVQFVKDGRNLTLSALRGDLRDKHPQPQWLKQDSEEAAQAAVEFAFKLWLMFPPVGWNDNTTLNKYVQSRFVSRPVSPNGNLPRVFAGEDLFFSARSLYHIGGLELSFTNDISQHLLLVERSQQLKIFRHPVLLYGVKSPVTKEVYPAGFLEETARSIELLFPRTEVNSHRWQKRIRQKADIDIELGQLGKLSSRNLDHYVYWHEQLVKLRDYFDETKPRKIRQWVHDTRDGNQRATFWLAVLAICLTLMFGFIQSITGIVALVLQARNAP